MTTQEKVYTLEELAQIVGLDSIPDDSSDEEANEGRSCDKDFQPAAQNSVGDDVALEVEVSTDNANPRSEVALNAEAMNEEEIVTDIRALQYLPSGQIEYKLSFDDDWAELPNRPKKVGSRLFPPLYNNRLAISDRKWKDLQELKIVLPADCHSFYDNLPH